MGAGNFIKVNNVSLKDPATYKPSIQDIDASANRNAAGYLCRDRVAVKRKLELTWNALTAAEMATLLSAVTDQFFSCTYIDPLTATWRTCQMYVGDRSTSAAYYNASTGAYIYDSLSMNFIER